MITAARAQVCQTICSNYIEGECSEHTTTCSTPAQPSASWGAIGYSRTTGSYGYSYSWGSQSKAESVAVKNCTKYAKDCEAIVWFNHQCGDGISELRTDRFLGPRQYCKSSPRRRTNQCMKGGKRDAKFKPRRVQ